MAPRTIVGPDRARASEVIVVCVCVEQSIFILIAVHALQAELAPRMWLREPG